MNKNQEKFEVWAKSKGWHLVPANPGSLDTYMDTDTEIAWMGWRAALQGIRSTDSERLDWLEAIDGRFANIDRIFSNPSKGFQAAEFSTWYKSLRLAIDASMVKEKL